MITKITKAQLEEIEAAYSCEGKEAAYALLKEYAGLEAAYILEAYLNVLRAFDAATKLHPLDTAERFDLPRGTLALICAKHLCGTCRTRIQTLTISALLRISTTEKPRKTCAF